MKQQDHTQVSSLQAFIAFVMAFITIMGALAVLINFKEAYSVTVNAETQGTFTLLQMMSFVTVIHTLANMIVFFSMFSRKTTRHWIIMWLLTAFSADLATTPIVMSLGRSIEVQIPYIISTFATYILLMGWFAYSEHARGFYKSYKEQTRELLNK